MWAGILDFAAAGAGEVAAEEGFEHEDEGVALAAAELLTEDVGGDGPHLGKRDGHKAPGSGDAGGASRKVHDDIGEGMGNARKSAAEIRTNRGPKDDQVVAFAGLPYALPKDAQ